MLNTCRQLIQFVPLVAFCVKSLHMVLNKSGALSPCEDYRALHHANTPDCNPLSNMIDLTSNLRSCQMFTKVDLVRAYSQIPVNPEDVLKTDVSTSFGKFDYVRMPFCLLNVAQTFKRFIPQVFRGVDSVYICLDAILVAGRSPKEHRSHIHQLLHQTATHGFTADVEMCQWGRNTITYLSHKVTSFPKESYRHNEHFRVLVI